MIFLASFGASCGKIEVPVTDEPLFKDVSRTPPKARPETIDAIGKDRPFAEWVIYQARQCEKYGCGI